MLAAAPAAKIKSMRRRYWMTPWFSRPSSRTASRPGPRHRFHAGFGSTLGRGAHRRGFEREVAMRMELSCASTTARLCVGGRVNDLLLLTAGPEPSNWLPR